LPGKKDRLVGRRKVSNATGGVSNAIGSKDDGAGIRNNKRAGGGQSRGATTKAAKTSRKLEEVAGLGGSVVPESFLNNSKVVVALMALVKGEDQRRGSRWLVSEAWA
jgi:hypothetical protein